MKEKGLMRRMLRWGVGLLAAWLVLTVGGDGTAQDATGYAPPPYQTPFPLYSTRPEDGGLFVAGSYVMYRQTNPLRSQKIAIRGFIDVDGEVINPFNLFR